MKSQCGCCIASVGASRAPSPDSDIATLLAACQTLEDTVQESVRRPNGPGKQQLQSVGQQLFEAVFSGDIGSAYRSSYAVASDRNDKLRVVLRLSDPRLASLPWEAMYDPRNDEYVCRNEPLVRHVEAKGDSGATRSKTAAAHIGLGVVPQ